MVVAEEEEEEGTRVRGEGLVGLGTRAEQADSRPRRASQQWLA